MFIKKFITNHKKCYAYENSEGDKGIIIAKRYKDAEKLFKKRYPNRKIANCDADYWNGGSYLFEIGNVENNMLYCAFPW